MEFKFLIFLLLIFTLWFYLGIDGFTQPIKSCLSSLRGRTSLTYTAYAANELRTRTIIINEVAWMGTKDSHYNEWIEIYNNSSSTVDLKGWKLIAEDGTPYINLKREIAGRDFFILERTDNQTLPDIEADLIYKGSLSNNGEFLKLIDNNREVVDQVDCGSGWIAGTNHSKKTMERKISSSNSNQWHTSQNLGGTPNSKNTIPKSNSNSSPSLNYTKNIASLTNQNKNWSRFGSGLVIALAIAIGSGAAILVVKKKLEGPRAQSSQF